MKIYEFSGKMCSACKMLEKRLTPYLNEHEINIDKRVYDDVDAQNFDETCELIDKYGVVNVPTLLCVNEDGTEVERLSGYMQNVNYEEIIDKWIK